MSDAPHTPADTHDYADDAWHVERSPWPPGAELQFEVQLIDGDADDEGRSVTVTTTFIEATITADVPDAQAEKICNLIAAAPDMARLLELIDQQGGMLDADMQRRVKTMIVEAREGAYAATMLYVDPEE